MLTTEETYVQRRVATLFAAGSLLALAPVLTATTAAAEEPALASPWAVDHNARARLIAGGTPAGSASGTIAVGVEIQLAKDWKTYWRNPGSSGVPPNLSWTPSSNVAAAETLYPAPARLADRDGDTIGYKGTVILPVAVRATDATKPVALVVEIEYGVCKDICIPVQSRLELTVPPGAASTPVAEPLARAFDRVPRSVDARRPTDPSLRATKIQLAGDKPSIRLEAEFPGGAEGADLFLEAPGGIWIPMAKAHGAPQGTIATFLVDLTDGADVGDLKGKTVRITLVSPRGQSETTLKIE
jgi:DsbC/DsbD-like thiol-disulfide interchange protein